MSQNSDMPDHTVKLLVVGESGVGKTNMILRFCENAYKNSYLSTIGIDLKIKDLLVDGIKLKLQIWDTAGQQRFRNITKTYYRGALGVVLVYSVDDRQSFETIQKWFDEVQNMTQEGTIKILVGNKADTSKREVSFEQGKKLAEELKVCFYETSAKNDVNIQTSFRQMSTLIKKNLLYTEQRIKIKTYTGSKIMRKKMKTPIKNKCC